MSSTEIQFDFATRKDIDRRQAQANRAAALQAAAMYWLNGAGATIKIVMLTAQEFESYIFTGEVSGEDVEVHPNSDLHRRQFAETFQCPWCELNMISQGHLEGCPQTWTVDQINNEIKELRDLRNMKIRHPDMEVKIYDAAATEHRSDSGSDQPLDQRPGD